MKKVLAALGTAAVLMVGGTACGANPGYTDSGYEQVWDHGHYTYVPYDYYQSHRSLYSNRLHRPHHYSSHYVTTHHVTVTHQTTVHSNGRTTTRTTTRHTTNYHRGGGSSYRMSSRRR